MNNAINVTEMKKAIDNALKAGSKLQEVNTKCIKDAEKVLVQHNPMNSIQVPRMISAMVANYTFWLTLPLVIQGEYLKTWNAVYRL